jgi:hypothetical protein
LVLRAGEPGIPNIAAFVSDIYSPNLLPLFFAGANLASMKASCQSNIPSMSSWERKARITYNQISSSVQRLRRRQQVDGLGYVEGKSFHGAPVRRIQRMPSKTSRLEASGRPPLGPGFQKGAGVQFLPTVYQSVLGSSHWITSNKLTT